MSALEHIRTTFDKAEQYIDGTVQGSALCTLVQLRRIREQLEEVEATLKSRANDEFRELQVKNPDKKEFEVADETGTPVATAVRYKHPGTWTYSEETVKLAATLKKTQEQEKKSGVAVHKDGESSVVFSLKLV